MWTVLNPVLKLQWVRKHYTSGFASEVKEALLQAVSAFNFVKQLNN
jgi:hypothetical protein